MPCFHEGSQKRKFEYLRIPINDGINKGMNEYFEETSRFIGWIWITLKLLILMKICEV